VINLHTMGHMRGVVCAPHAAAAADGQRVLINGGNALEAMIAMAASITAVYPHMNHIGGDAFWLVHEPGGSVHAIMGAGPCGSKATVEFYRDHGFDAIPPRGPLAALTVPAAVSTWMLAEKMARKHGGKLPLKELLAAAIGHARNGYIVSRSQSALTNEKLSEMAEAKGFQDTFLVNGKVPVAGSTLKQPLVANTLEHLAENGLDDFYRGDIGREMAADLENIGSPVSRSDLLQYRAVLAEPLSAQVGSGTIYNTPLPTQGLASLIILGVFELLGVRNAETFEFVHGVVESTKRAFMVRDRVVCDPARNAIDVRLLLSSRFFENECRHIDFDKAAPWPEVARKGDTIWMGAVDASGLAVSFIQSIYWEFGSGCVLPRTGILMQNRGASFSLNRQALNMLAPGRLPFHTLNPALAVLNDGRVMAYGTMGGEGQPQTQAALFARYVMYGQALGSAIAAPRWLLGRTWGSPHTNLRMESRFEPNVVRQMVAAGHDVEVIADKYSDVMGHAGAAIIHPDGSMEGAHDPRADGGAAGA